MSRTDDIKNRIKNRDARSSLMGNAVRQKEIDNNININNNVSEDIYEIINKKSGTKSVKELVGIYFEPEVKRALDKLQKAEGRGAKSELVNDITKWALQQKGLL